MVAPKSSAGPFGAMPRTKVFRVLATFHVGMYEYDNTYVYMPLETAQRFFKLGGGVTNIEVTTADPESVREVGARILAATDPGMQVFDWRQSNASFVSALEVERNVMFLILTLIIMVAAFNVLSSMIMLVKDKARDIAILRAIGSTRGSMMRIFFLTGSSIGVIGTGVGFGSASPVRRISSACAAGSRGSPARTCSRRRSISFPNCRPRWIRPRWRR